MTCYKFDRKFHYDDFLMSKGCAENLKLPLDHDSLYLCLLHLVLLWLGFLKLNGYFEKHHGKKGRREKK